MKCTRCEKEIDETKTYMTIGVEVGDRSNLSISESQIKKWDAMEEKNEKPFCYECGNIFEETEKQLDKLKKIKEDFLK